MAQAADSLPDGPVACDAFQRVGNGSWTVLRPATLYPNRATLNLSPGQTFAPNQMYDGFEATGAAAGNRADSQTAPGRFVAACYRGKSRWNRFPCDGADHIGEYGRRREWGIAAIGG
jgi:hypothetical protein